MNSKPEIDTIDYLDVDKPISGQNFVCLSFLSPENMIERRELFLLENFRNDFLKLYEEWNECHKLSYELLKDIKKQLPDTFINENEFNENENESTIQVSKKDILNLNNKLSDLQSKLDVWNFINKKKSMEDFWEEFQLNSKEKYEKIFLDENKNACSMRGIKCRGVFNTLDEAQLRAKKLHKKDKYFNVFVGQVGYWLPWDPNASNVENQEYSENRLNDLMKNYKANQDNKDEVWEEQVRLRKQGN
jgi:hypothetical protein